MEQALPPPFQWEDGCYAERLPIPGETGLSREQSVDHLTMDIRQTKITTCVAERETLMIESQQVQNGRVEVMHVDRIFFHPVTNVVRLSVYDPRFHPPTSEPA